MPLEEEECTNEARMRALKILSFYSELNMICQNDTRAVETLGKRINPAIEVHGTQRQTRHTSSYPRFKVIIACQAKSE
jgi:hypothetical protein